MIKLNRFHHVAGSEYENYEIHGGFGEPRLPSSSSSSLPGLLSGKSPNVTSISSKATTNIPYKPLIPKVVNLKVGHFENGRRQLVYDLDLSKGSDGFKIRNSVSRQKYMEEKSKQGKAKDPHNISFYLNNKNSNARNTAATSTTPSLAGVTK